jgi:hypothetical protein
MSGQLHAPAAFTLGEKAPGIHCVGVWVNPRTSLDVEKKKFLTLPGLELRTLGRPADCAFPASILHSVLISTFSVANNFIFMKTVNLNFFKRNLIGPKQYIVTQGVCKMAACRSEDYETAYSLL